MPEAKGRKNRRDRERLRRRVREPGVPLPEDEQHERAAREARLHAAPPVTARVTGGRRAAGPVELPSTSVRITGAMVGILTMLGAAYMIIAGILNGGGIDSYVSIGAGVILLAVGVFAAALSLAPLQIRNFVRRDG
jgi:hypothetical protein